MGRSYFPGIDGLRGLAILSVMTYHFFDSRFTIDQRASWDFNPVRFGWVGVDLFFVISGFLITLILVSQKKRPHYFRNFFFRRTLRIFPLYFGFLFLFFTLPVLLGLKMPASWDKLSTRQEFFWFYLADLYTFWFNSWPEFSLSHFWSLGIEEKFYLFWPFVIYAFSTKAMKIICALLFFISIFSKILMLGYHENGVLVNYTFPFCRLEGLVSGSYLALLFWEGKRTFNLNQYFLIALSLGVYLGIYIHEKTLAPMTLTMQLIGFPLNALVCFFLVSSALQKESLVTRLVDHSALRFLGKYSYALYLIHLPLLGLLTKLSPLQTKSHSVLPSFLPFLVWVLFSLLFARISWLFLENPFLKLKKHFQ